METGNMVTQRLFDNIQVSLSKRSKVITGDELTHNGEFCGTWYGMF